MKPTDCLILLSLTFLPNSTNSLVSIVPLVSPDCHQGETKETRRIWGGKVVFGLGWVGNMLIFMSLT